MFFAVFTVVALLVVMVALVAFVALVTMAGVVVRVVLVATSLLVVVSMVRGRCFQILSLVSYFLDWYQRGTFSLQFRIFH
jgi:hypothetical protein